MRDSSKFIKRKKEDVYCMGYFLDTATDVVPATSTTPLTYHIFGTDEILTGMNVDTGTLSITMLDQDADNNAFLDLLSNQNPGTYAGGRQYSWSNVTTPVSVWINKKDNSNTYYRSATLFKNWRPTAGLSAGGPNDDTVRTFAGNSTAATEILSGCIFGELLTCTQTGVATLTKASTTMQLAGSVSGLQIIAIQDSTAVNLVTEDVPVSTNMIVGGVVSGTYILSGCSTLTSFDKVYVIYAIKEQNGIYPNSPFTNTAQKYRG